MSLGLCSLASQCESHGIPNARRIATIGGSQGTPNASCMAQPALTERCRVPSVPPGSPVLCGAGGVQRRARRRRGIMHCGAVAPLTCGATVSVAAERSCCSGRSRANGRDQGVVDSCVLTTETLLWQDVLPQRHKGLAAGCVSYLGPCPCSHTWDVVAQVSAR